MWGPFGCNVLKISRLWKPEGPFESFERNRVDIFKFSSSPKQLARFSYLQCPGSSWIFFWEENWPDFVDKHLLPFLEKWRMWTGCSGDEAKSDTLTGIMLLMIVYHSAEYKRVFGISVTVWKTFLKALKNHQRFFFRKKKKFELRTQLLAKVSDREKKVFPRSHRRQKSSVRSFFPLLLISKVVQLCRKSDISMKVAKVRRLTQKMNFQTELRHSKSLSGLNISENWKIPAFKESKSTANTNFQNVKTILLSLKRQKTSPVSNHKSEVSMVKYLASFENDKRRKEVHVSSATFVFPSSCPEKYFGSLVPLAPKFALTYYVFGNQDAIVSYQYEQERYRS